MQEKNELNSRGQIAFKLKSQRDESKVKDSIEIIMTNFLLISTASSHEEKCSERVN